jgi:chemotaxis protein MotB
MSGQDKAELVIVRRRSAFDEAEHKGGVWKIAYADFMTAMMAFFLVMWLINAVNQETRESVASYFNPVRLAESTPDRKGLNEPRRVDPGKAEEADSKSPLAQPSPTREAHDSRVPGQQPRFDEAALFRDPYSVLSEIAGGPPNAVRREARIGALLDATQQQGMKGGEAYRDPFDPIYWQVSPRAPVETKAPGPQGSLPMDEEIAALEKGDGRRPPEGKLDATVTPAETGRPGEPGKPDQGKGDAAEPGVAAAAAAPGEAPAAGTAQSGSGRSAESSDAAQLQAAIAAALGPDPGPRPQIEVRRTDEGVLVSLTDDINFGMFAIGSAEPRPELVRAIDKVGPLIAKHTGPLVVRGHTDNRPFRSHSYDNWRLSTARAHMAYHMLVRAGINPLRVERIEGHADRTPKVPTDPAAAPNRRIEVLLREPRR